MWMHVLPASSCALYACNAQGGQKRASYTLGLNLWMAVNPPLGFGRAAPAVDHYDNSIHLSL